MSELIEREKAIDAIRNATFSFTVKSDIDFANYRKVIQEIFDNVLDAQEKALNELPAAQPQSTMGQVNETAESNNDCISRQAAIDAMCGACSDWCDEGVCKKVSALQKLPSAQQWIPCSERLPEVETYVLISKKPFNFRSNLPSVCMAHRSCDPRSGKEKWYDMLFGELDDDDVLAWMPLPEPYRGGDT